MIHVENQDNKPSEALKEKPGQCRMLKEISWQPVQYIYILYYYIIFEPGPQ